MRYEASCIWCSTERWWQSLAQVPPAMPGTFVPDIEAARQIVAAALADGRGWLDPIEIKRLFDAYEIAMVPTFAAADAEQAVAHASELFAQGMTVVLKIMSRDIVHKSDVGGVVLNLTSADAVRTRRPRSWRAPRSFVRRRGYPASSSRP